MLLLSVYANAKILIGKGAAERPFDPNFSLVPYVLAKDRTMEFTLE